MYAKSILNLRAILWGQIWLTGQSVNSYVTVNSKDIIKMPNKEIFC